MKNSLIIAITPEQAYKAQGHSQKHYFYYNTRSNTKYPARIYPAKPEVHHKITRFLKENKGNTSVNRLTQNKFQRYYRDKKTYENSIKKPNIEKNSQLTKTRKN